MEAGELWVPRRRWPQVLVHGDRRGVRPALWHRRHRGRGAAPGDAGAVLHVSARAGQWLRLQAQLPVAGSRGRLKVHWMLCLTAAVDLPQPRGSACTLGAQHCSSKCRNAVLRVRSADTPACRKNGEHLGSAYRNVVATALVPTIGLHRCLMLCRLRASTKHTLCSPTGHAARLHYDKTTAV